MTTEQHEALRVLDAEERAGKMLTGAEKGRLADLRREEILMIVKSMIEKVAAIDFNAVASAITKQLPETNPATADREIR